MQIAGERCVTAFVKPEQLSRRIEHRDAFDFVVHDLKHMENFTGDPKDTYPEQIGLLAAVGNPEVATQLGHLDEQFLSHFSYVLADMNSRSDHLFSFFKAKLLCAHVRSLAATTAADAFDQPARSPQEAAGAPAAAGGATEQLGQIGEGQSPVVSKQQKERIWLTPEEEAAFAPFWRETLSLIGLSEGSGAWQEAQGLYDIDPVAHVHKRGFGMPLLREHFRSAGLTQIAALEQAFSTESCEETELASTDASTDAVAIQQRAERFGLCRQKVRYVLGAGNALSL